MKEFDAYASREVLEFIKREESLSLYEKACNFSESIIKINFDELKEKQMEDIIKFSGLKISPSGPVSLSIILFLIMIPLVFLLVLPHIISISTAFAIIALLGFLCAWVYYNPILIAMSIRAKASSEMVLCILYMAISLRDIPNLERAVLSAASNLDGPIGKDLKRLMWKLQTSQLFSVEDGLNNITFKWYKEGKEFVEALKLLIASVHQIPELGEKTIDEAVSVVVSGTHERMNRYARGLKMPVMLVFTMGLMLPVISLVMFPMIMIFLPDIVNVSFLIILYDIIIPGMLFWVIMSILQSRPVTTSSIDTGKLLTLKVYTKGGGIPIHYILIPIIIILLVVFGIPLYIFHTQFTQCSEWQKCDYARCKSVGLHLTVDECKSLMIDVMSPALNSVSLLLGACISAGILVLLSIYRYTHVRERVRRLESELGEALFQLGYQIRSGKPIEAALDTAIKNLENMEIAEFYKNIIMNIKNLGMNFESAIFDKNIGAIRKYPSKLINSIMMVIVNTSKKGMTAASNSMLVISNYLKNTYKLQENIDEIMSETVSTMKFMGMFLSPLIAGVTVALAIIVLNIILVLSFKLPEISGAEGMDMPTTGTESMFFGLWKNGVNVGVDVFQLVIGIYVIETAIVSAIFINGLENGYDRISELSMMGKMLIISSVIFAITSFAIYLTMGGLIQSLLLGSF